MPRALPSAKHAASPGGDLFAGAPAASTVSHPAVVALPTAKALRNPATAPARQRRTESKRPVTPPIEIGAMSPTQSVQGRDAAIFADVVPNPGGYVVSDAPSISGTGRPEEVGRVVRAEAGYEAWDRVESGYRRIGRFPDSAAARDALGRQAALKESKPKSPGAARRRGTAKA